MPTENKTADALPTLATGAALDASTWNDFLERLRYHCNGAGVSGTTLQPRFSPCRPSESITATRSTTRKVELSVWRIDAGSARKNTRTISTTRSALKSTKR